MKKTLLFLLILLFPLHAAMCLSPDELEPVLGINERGVSITVKSALTLDRVRLFWTHREIPEEPCFDPFQRYTFYESSEKPRKTHMFFLPFERKKKTYYQPDLPLDRVVHFRIQAIAPKGKSRKSIISKEYRFRAIRDKAGAIRFGLLFSNGPLVAFTGEDRAVISWESNFPSLGSLEFFREGKSDKKILESNEKSRGFVIKLDHLRARTNYNYRVICRDPKSGDSILSPVYRFRTAPLEGGEFCFAVMGASEGDPHSYNPDESVNGVNVRVLNRLSRDALDKGADFILFTGDLVAGGAPDRESAFLRYKTWKEAVAGVNAFIPVYPAMGRNDSICPKESGGEIPTPEEVWRTVFVLPEQGPVNRPRLPTYRENVYSMKYGGVHFTALNSSYNNVPENSGVNPGFIATIDQVQRDWFQLELEENKSRRFHFVFFSEPAYPCSVFYGRSLDSKPDERDAVVTILDKYRVDAFFCGHEHAFSRLFIDKKINPNLKNGTWQIITGGAGGAAHPPTRGIPWFDSLEKYETDYHWIFAEVKKGETRFTVFNIKGDPIDSFTLEKRKKPR